MNNAYEMECVSSQWAHRSVWTHKAVREVDSVYGCGDRGRHVVWMEDTQEQISADIDYKCA